jgi:Flp pilus assembly protein TadD
VAARIAYALALTQFGDCPRAAQSVRAGLGRTNTECGEAILWATLGDVLVQGGDFLGAEDAYAQAEQFSGFAARAAAGMARVHGKLGRYKDAFASLSTVAQANKILES